MPLLNSRHARASLAAAGVLLLVGLAAAHRVEGSTHVSTYVCQKQGRTFRIVAKRAHCRKGEVKRKLNAKRTPSPNSSNGAKRSGANGANGVTKAAAATPPFGPEGKAGATGPPGPEGPSGAEGKEGKEGKAGSGIASGNPGETSATTDEGELVVNVKTYGAKGDGITDDTAAIQAAIDHANAMGSGVVYVPTSERPYMFSNLKLGAYVVLEGGTMLRSTLRRILGSTGNAIQEKSVDEGNTYGATGIQIKNIHIQGAGTVGDGINLGNQGSYQFSTRAYLQHVFVSGFPSGAGFNINSNACWFADLWSIENRDGFNMEGGGANFYYGLWAEDNFRYEVRSDEPWNHFYGVQIENAGTSGTNPAMLLAAGAQFVQGVYVNWGTAGTPEATKPGIIDIASGITDVTVRDTNVIGAGRYTNTVRSVAYGTGSGKQEYLDEYDYVSGAGKKWHQDSSTGTITQE